ncbi:hypothetical protein SSBR45G_71310 [Bradyrhizobium sp. SSBR45G]|uniref:hypothetical protein n=1 Tax=unclassified Bradyrhizobium TaxID=2631580 RepID=UPI00234293C3|nr:MULTISPECIES: hypothetical protein [unclassified Bradyrhizobium]GLH82222.1 hypothetical protein SSBR45G_71310 [Bradyrhizobium sp. SSBR45G]GLH89655.1 hypothetical protein SSBR45R_71160 [Bradyrhizobium sp. SSBR45R]
MKPFTCAAIFATLLLSVVMPAASAQAVPSYDLRDITVGMPVGDLPNDGYVNLVCAGDPDRKLDAWSSWRNCPADDQTRRAVRFEFDPETSQDGTKVAGHPVLLTAVIDDKGKVSGLTIETDPKARLYIRKKAFLLGNQVKSRYGADGWDCKEQQPTASEQPVGGVFLREVCKKSVPGRMLTVERELFRKPDQDAKSFVDQTRIQITTQTN